MNPFLLTAIIILGVYVLTLIVNIVFAISFRIIMNKHSKAITIILKSKLDNIKIIMDVLQKNNVELTDEITGLCGEIERDSHSIITSNTIDNEKKNLSYLKGLCVALANENKDLLEDEQYLFAIENINQLDNVYRSNVIMYNADVLGYNYWVRFLPCRFIWLLLKVKTKDLIS